MPPMDLIEKMGENKQEYIKALSKSTKKHYLNDKFKVGDKILFIAGYYNHLEFKSEILGFDDDGGIYVLWDCYWFPIFDNEIRNIRKTD